MVAKKKNIVMRANHVGMFYNNKLNFFGKKNNEFWALKDISFELHEGECLGVIGRNGAGKSSLLRLIAGIHKPDRGTFESFGNSVALLTLGAGFMNHLSGRDNMILGAQLLGLTRREIKERLPKMIAYAELGDFINEPLYSYSSGMRARLGFAVAVQSDPKVLLIDETLGVGDTVFREKSARTIENMITSEGKTVVLISHNPVVIEDLTTRLIWLKDGVSIHGEVDDLIKQYQRSSYALKPYNSQFSSNRGSSNQQEDELYMQFKAAFASADISSLSELTQKFLKNPSRDIKTQRTYVIATGLLEQYKEAIEFIKSHDNLASKPNFQSLLGFYYFAQNRFVEAKECFGKLIAEGYIASDVILQLAYIYSLEKDHESAKRFFAQVIVLLPDFVSNLLPLPIGQIITQGYQGVIEVIEKIEPRTYALTKALAYANIFICNYHASSLYFKQLSSCDNYLAEDQLWEARVLRVLGKYDESSKILTYLMKLRPQSNAVAVEFSSLKSQ